MFLTKADLLNYMEQDEIDQITEGNDAIVDEVIKDALEYAAEKLRQRYNIENEYAKTGEDRHRQLLKQTTAISLMYLSERLPTDILPEARELAYDRAVSWLDEAGNGKRMLTLEPRNDEEQEGWALRWGVSGKNSGKFL